MQIWKYELSPGRNEIKMPKNSIVLDVQEQYGKPIMWVLVNTYVPMVTRILDVYTTGDNIVKMPGDYIGTIQLNSGSLVFHVFESSHKLKTKQEDRK